MRNYYFEMTSNEVCDILVGRSKPERNRVSGSWSIITIGDKTSIIVNMSAADRQMSNVVNATYTVDKFNTIELIGKAEPGFYQVQEISDRSPDGYSYIAFCTGSTLYRMDVGFTPHRRIRLDRRVKTKPISVGDIEQLIERAANNKDLKKVLSNLLKEEDKKEEKKRNSNPPRPAEI